MITIKCRACRKLVQTPDKRQKFCGTSCYHNAQKLPFRKCSVKKCYLQLAVKGLCNSHYSKMKRWGNPLISFRGRKGLGTKTNSGYIVHCINGKHIGEHRLVMEKHIGRSLNRNEHVHHIDHNKSNNMIENLELLDAGAHLTKHLVERWSKPRQWAHRLGFDACIMCGRNDVKHSVQGHCNRCRNNVYRFAFGRKDVQGLWTCKPRKATL